MSSEAHDSHRSEASSGARRKSSANIRHRLAAYKEANPLDVAYYARVARDAPSRAVDMLLFKDMCRDEDGMQLLDHVMPDLAKIQSILDEPARARIDDRVRQSALYQKAKVFATEVLREAGRAIRRKSNG